MLALGKKTDYALISLSWLAEHDGQTVSAREISEANDLPLPVLMQILKVLHHHGILSSTRGVKGGYRVAVDLNGVSLQALSELLMAGEHDESADLQSEIHQEHVPLMIMRHKLSKFLSDVSVADVIRPHSRRPRRVDVPLEDVRICERVTV